jgi:hypothetical protein
VVKKTPPPPLQGKLFTTSRLASGNVYILLIPPGSLAYGAPGPHIDVYIC